METDNKKLKKYHAVPVKLMSLILYLIAFVQMFGFVRILLIISRAIPIHEEEYYSTLYFTEFILFGGALFMVIPTLIIALLDFSVLHIKSMRLSRFMTIFVVNVLFVELIPIIIINIEYSASYYKTAALVNVLMAVTYILNYMLARRAFDKHRKLIVKAYRE